jgi:hypothetical protein
MERYIKTVSIVCFLLVFLTLMNNSVYASKKPNWWKKTQQLTVLESTRNDLEKLFKPFTISYERKFKQHVEIQYDTKEGKLFVGYSLGRCSPESDKNGEDVEKDVLVMIGFTPKKPVKISNLNIDLSGFFAVKEEDSEAFYYRSRDLGIEYAIRNEKLEAVSYMLPKSKESLRCKQ